MRTSLRRIFDDKRRIMLPVLGGLAVNILLYAIFVYPLSVRVPQHRGSRTDCGRGAAGCRAR